MTDRGRIIEEGLAAFAVTLAEMGATEDEARPQIVGMMVQSGVGDAEAAQVARAASAAVTRMPQPIDETPEEISRAQPFRDMLGVPSAEHHLVGAMQGREWLNRLAEDFERSVDE